MTALAPLPAEGDPHAPLLTAWTVYTTWRAYGSTPATEHSETHPDWPTARQHALQYACLAGVRYVTVTGEHDVVVGDWDTYTNRWREYALHVGACDNWREIEDEPCDGQLYARPSDIQVRCPRCRGWVGYRSLGVRQPFEPA